MQSFFQGAREELEVLNYAECPLQIHLACDAVVERLTGIPRIVWATDTLTQNSNERSAYIAALTQADELNFQPLIDYLAKLNPDH